MGSNSGAVTQNFADAVIAALVGHQGADGYGHGWHMTGMFTPSESGPVVMTFESSTPLRGYVGPSMEFVGPHKVELIIHARDVRRVDYTSACSGCLHPWAHHDGARCGEENCTCKREPF